MAHQSYMKPAVSWSLQEKWMVYVYLLVLLLQQKFEVRRESKIIPSYDLHKASSPTSNLPTYGLQLARFLHCRQADKNGL